MKNATIAPNWVSALRPSGRASHLESKVPDAQKSTGLPVGQLSGRSSTEARDKKMGEKDEYSQWFVRWPWARSGSDDGYQTAETSATKLHAGKLTHKGQAEASKQGFSLWPWGRSSRSEVLVDTSKIPTAAAQPVADGTRASFEISRPTSPDAVAARENAGGGAAASQEGVSRPETLMRGVDKSMKEASGVWRFELVRRFRRLFRPWGKSSSTTRIPDKRRVYGATDGEPVIDAAIKEAMPRTRGASIQTGINGGTENSYFVHVSADASHSRNDRSRGEGFRMILACMMGTLACALTAVGTVRVLRTRRGDGEGDQLPLVMRDLEDHGSSSEGDKDVPRAATKEGKKDGHQDVVRIYVHEEDADGVVDTVDEIVRDVVDEIVRKDAV